MVQQQKQRQSGYADLYEGLHHVLSFFEDCSETPLGRYHFPRTISTAATNGRQYLVESREEVLTYFKAALRKDCRINAYADYDILKRMGQLPQDYNPPPRHLFIDIDRKSFETERN